VDCFPTQGFQEAPTHSGDLIGVGPKPFLGVLKYITGKCSDKIRLIVVSNSPTFLCWADAYMLRRSCLSLARANQHMRHTVIRTNQLMHAPSICTIFNTPLWISVELQSIKY
jgi:hypothetical protein